MHSKLFVLVLLTGTGFFCLPPTGADILPPAVPENQMISVYSYIETIGVVIEKSSFTSESSSAYLHNGILFGSDADIGNAAFGERVAQIVWRDKTITNGGYLKETKTFGYGSGNQGSQGYNLQTDKILTYESIDGSTLAASERISMEICGNYSDTAGLTRCVFGSGNRAVNPAFCNIVTAESNLIGVTSISAQTSMDARFAASDADIPAALSYKIDVSPNTASGAEYAMGTVETEFSARIMEANDRLDDNHVYYDPAHTADPFANYWDDSARITTYSDRTMVSGGITRVTKAFAYQSGMSL
ncbi:MAG: hypothetical protein JXA44_06625 [Methanospirillaceae archaeon]|nr:hypothetical protein [Methanospirillaceae archaeon]